MIQLPGRDVRSRFGLPGALGKRAVARLIRFAVHYQEAVNERMIAGIGEVRDAVGALEQQTEAGRQALEHRIASSRDALEHQIAAGREALATFVTSVDRRIEELRAQTAEAGESQLSRMAILRRELATERAVQRKLSFAQTLLEERVDRSLVAHDAHRGDVRAEVARLGATFAGVSARVDGTEQALAAVSESAAASTAAAAKIAQTLAVNVALVRELTARQDAIDERLATASLATSELHAALESVHVALEHVAETSGERSAEAARDDHAAREDVTAKFDALERSLEDVRTMQREDGARMADILGAIDALANASREMSALVAELNDVRTNGMAVAAQAALHIAGNGAASYANGTSSAFANGASADVSPDTSYGRLDAKLNATPYMARDVFDSANGSAPRGGGFDYLGFEEIFRGPEDFIKDRQRAYLQFFPQGSRVLDAGCGRGEMLDLLREARVDATGVDVNEAMIARCRAKGLDNVVHADVLAYLNSQPEDSFDAVFSAQVIEHLGFDALYAFCERALRSLARNGVFIAETVNPNCFEALKMFHVDPTHQHPLFPETMRFLCRSAGFRDARIFYPTGDGFAEREPCLRGEYAVVAWK